MASTVEFSIRGIDRLHKKLKGVSAELTNKTGRAALRKAANVVANDARMRALALDDPDTGRKIADNVAVQFASKTFRQTGVLMMRVGVRWGALSEKSNPDLGPGSKTFHWRFLELGTEKMKEQPFLRPALTQNVNKVLDTLVVEMEKGIDRAIKKGGA